MTATARLEFRVSPAGRSLIERAAELVGEPITAFARSAAEQRAEKILQEHEMSTVVPEEFFGDLLTALDEPAAPNPALAKLATKHFERFGRD